MKWTAFRDYDWHNFCAVVAQRPQHEAGASRCIPLCDGRLRRAGLGQSAQPGIRRQDQHARTNTQDLSLIHI